MNTLILGLVVVGLYLLIWASLFLVSQLVRWWLKRRIAVKVLSIYNPRIALCKVLKPHADGTLHPEER